MKKRKIVQMILLGSSLALEQSCWFKKEPRKATIIIPPAPQPAPPAQLPLPPTLAPVTYLPPMKGKTELPSLPAPIVKPQPKKSRPSRKSPATAAAGATGPAEAIVEGPSLISPSTFSPAPSLQPILATHEAGERTKRIQEYLERARTTVFRAERNRPDGKARELIVQVRTFIQQAEESRKTDLVRAENLAERADVLSRGLR